MFSYILGILTEGNIYTSPVLEIHTWYKSGTHITINEIVGEGRLALGGRQTKRDNADRRLESLVGVEHKQLELEEDIIVIPIESILSIKAATEVNRKQTERRQLRARTPIQSQPLSCCAKCSQWCCRAFCCCNPSDAKVHNEPEVVTTIEGENADRKVLVTIEYIRYSNIDTPSHVRALDTVDRTAFYKENFHTETLKFYLLDSSEFDATNFELRREQGAKLCRIVTQLKTMVRNYPDEQKLLQIINHNSEFAIGESPKETISSIAAPTMVLQKLEVKALAIEQ
jgi:hypothetical protein